MKFLSADSIACRTPSSVSTTRTRAVCNRATACETSDLTRKTVRVSSIDATSCSARRWRIRPMLPIPPFCNCQTAATSISMREPLELSDLVRAGGEVAGREQPRGRGRAEDDQVRQERAVLLLAQELLRRGDQLAPRGDLGAVVQRDRHQLLGGLLGGDERDLEERRLDRLEQRGRVEQEDFRQPGAGDPPVADGDLLGLPEALELGLRPVDLQRRDQARGQPRGEVHEQLGPRRSIAPTPSSLPRAAWRSKKAWATVIQAVVPRGLEVGLPRGDHPPRRERGEDGVGEPDGQAGPAADEEALPPLPEIRAREDVLLDAVVPEVVDARVEVRDPERPWPGAAGPAPARPASSPRRCRAAGPRPVASRSRD